MFLAEAARLEEATEQAQQAVVVGDALVASDPKNATAANTLAQSLSQLAKCHLESALASNAPAAHRIDRLRDARTSYERSRDTWVALRDGGSLSTVEAGKVDEATRQIAPV